MPQWKPAKRSQFVHRPRQLGFQGPYAGAKHQFMVLGQHRWAIPNN
jgi:hypothetical protein